MAQPKGTVRVRLGFRSDELRDAILPMRVQRPDLTLVAEGVSSSPLELDAGTYYITVQMPAGQELSAKVEVAAGASELVEIDPYPGIESPPGAQEVERFLGGRHFDPEAGREPRASSDRRFRLWDVLMRRGNPPGRLRLFAGNLLAGECRPLNGTAAGFTSERVGQAVRLRASAADASLVQLLQPGCEPLNVAFPAGDFGGCFLHLRKHEDSYYSLDVHIADATADSFMRYVEEGRLADASVMTDALKVVAGKLLRAKRKDPAAAAVSVYALLGFSGSGRLWEWADELWPLFEWLPDALCIRGERLAREGRHAAALGEFIRLPERGLPFFTDGLTYTLDRLKLYLSASRSPFDARDLEAAERLLARLEGVCNCVDFGRQLTTFTGVDPLSPDDEEFDGDVDGVEGFDPSSLRFGPAA